MNSKRVAVGIAILLIAVAVSLAGCLDADPIGAPHDNASVSVQMSVIPARPGKTVAIDSIRIAIYDVAGDASTAVPDTFPLAALAEAGGNLDGFLEVNDATGTHFLSTLRIDLTEKSPYRVVAYLAIDGEGEFDGERSVELKPGEDRALVMVMSDAGPVNPGSFDLSLSKTVVAVRDIARIPVILENADLIGGIQFRLVFDREVVESVTGIEVDPASRLYVEREDGTKEPIESSFNMPTDSTVQVVTVDLHVGEGDSLEAPLAAIPPGRDLVCFVRLDLIDNLTGLPDTMDLRLENVFFSTPSGSTDIAVPDPRGALLIITE